MNERIKELSLQASNSIPDDVSAEHAMYLFQKKFAELLIKECISIVDKRKDAAIDADWHVDEAMSNAVWDIEEHFGVEE